MLQQLHIENYALIDRLTLELGPGLNLLTGETGSGKSIVVDALALLLGGRSSPEVIRGGAERAVLCGEFRAAVSPALRRAAEGLGVELENGVLLIKRELHVSGRTRAFINDRPATISALRALAPWLADIHGQNEQQALFDEEAQLELLDRFAGAEEDAEKTADAWSAWRRAAARLAELTRNEQEKLRLADLWSFQKKEIDAAQLIPGEDERLAAEKRVLANSARISAAVQSAYQQLYDAPGAAASSIAGALKSLEDAARFDPALGPVCDALRAARANVEDASFSLRDSLEKLEANPERLEQVEDRLATLDRLKRKYGPALADVLAHLETVRRQLAELESSDELAREARAELDGSAARYSELAAALSARRKEGASRLERAVMKTLRELAMERTAFRIELVSCAEQDAWKATGVDRLRFLISANPGEPLRPVDQVASGGELSRLMLALIASSQRPAPRAAAGDGETARTLVFDEIDAGIGGRVAETVGRKLKSLAAAHQVLCVTHLPQIASFADGHYFVEKAERNGRAVTLARRLRESERAAELARMLAGVQVTETALKHAREMLARMKNEE